MQSDAVADAGTRGLNGVVRQVCVPRRGLHLGVTEELANPRQAFAESQGPRRKVVP